LHIPTIVINDSTDHGHPEKRSFWSPWCIDGTLFVLSDVIPVGLNKLNIAAAAGGGYLHVHAATEVLENRR
jgi:hypothetical protein